MTDHGIIFTAENAQKIWDGQKTMTRPLLTRLSGFGKISELDWSTTPGYDWQFRDKEMRWNDLTHGQMVGALPYATGDRLWVREPWQAHTEFDKLPPRDLVEADVLYIGSRPDMLWDARKRAAKHMPKWASRMTLIVNDVRVERLWEISFEDCRAEGCDPCFEIAAPDCNDPTCKGSHYGEKWHFQHLWESIHGPGSWDENPWVMAIEFDAVRWNIGRLAA